MAFCRNLTNQVISSPAAQISVQAPRNLFLKNDIRKTVKLIYYLIKKITCFTLRVPSTGNQSEMFQ